MGKSMRRIIIALVILCAGVGAYYFTHRDTGSNTSPSVARHNQNQASQSKKKTPSTPQSLGASFNKSTYPLDNASSLWVIVNKQRPLNPANYTPAHLVVPDIPLRSNITRDEKYVRSDNAVALKAMVDAAETDGIHLNLQSGYRSYAFQVNLYNLYVKQQGKTLADSQSARPGFSEHQTGLAADLGGTSQPGCNVEACFATTKEGKWLAANAYKYGYIIRYPEGKTDITGYTYEPWHVRYVGTDLSEEMHSDGILTLEEFFGTGAAADYQ